jgi:hypothetical protein
MAWVVKAKFQPLYPRERPGTHCIGGWVGLRASLEGAENLDQTEIRSTDRHPVASRYTGWAIAADKPVI